jgi:hypothetical protein
MAFPKSSVLVADTFASGPGPPWSRIITSTWSFEPSLALGSLPAAMVGRPPHSGDAHGPAKWGAP